mgnify:CR=1 FL=1
MTNNDSYSETHDVHTITYGGRIDTDAQTMVNGMIELFDDLCDMALSRVYNRTCALDGGFDFDALPPEEISRFKITWVISLAELMFFSMQDQPRIGYLRSTFYDKMSFEATERTLQTFVSTAQALIPATIRADKDFVDNEVFNVATTNHPESAETPRNRGLGPKLAQMILENAFGKNLALRPVYEEVRKVVELEFSNAYGHCSIACSKFNIV